MIKRIIIFFVLINLMLLPTSYASDEIISSQIDALNLSSFIKEGENYTKDVFPDISLNDFFNSSINGEINNKEIYKGVLALFGDEIVSSISLLGSILIIIIIHSLLKNFTDNLSNSDGGIGQIAYYVEYILIVTLVMVNFSNIISMIKESISNLVGFVNSLVPILLALMSASRKYCISSINTTINNFCNYIYSKHNNTIYITNYINCNSIRNNIKFIWKSTNRKII